MFTRSSVDILIRLVPDLFGSMLFAIYGIVFRPYSTFYCFTGKRRKKIQEWYKVCEQSHNKCIFLLTTTGKKHSISKLIF